MAALGRMKIQIKPTFSGNVEGAIGQLQSGRVSAAGVNSKSIEAFARRENLRYRVLWSSVSYPEFALATLASIPEDVAQAVRDAFLDMPNDPLGLKIIRESADMVGSREMMRFVPATIKDYETYRLLYRTALP
jgi:phosphonate transport system substrate-binding protein